MPSDTAEQLNAAFAGQIYDLMTGLYDLSLYHSPLSGHVPNAFTSDPRCTALLTEIYTARQTLGNRLGTNEEDPDIMTVIDCYEQMQRIFCEKMFACASKLSEMRQTDLAYSEK